MATILDGLHLILDGNVKDSALFAPENLKQMFEELASALDTQFAHGPVFKEIEVDPAARTGDLLQDEGGISGYALMSTAHASIHCRPLRQTFMSDLFSYRLFNHEKAMAIFERFLKPGGLNVRVIVRRPDVVV